MLCYLSLVAKYCLLAHTELGESLAVCLRPTQELVFGSSSSQNRLTCTYLRVIYNKKRFALRFASSRGGPPLPAQVCNVPEMQTGEHIQRVWARPSPYPQDLGLIPGDVILPHTCNLT